MARRPADATSALDAQLEQRRVRVGVIGCGYWGPHLIRNLHDMPEATWLIQSAATSRR